MLKKKRFYKKSKWEDEICLFESKILKFEQNNVFKNEKFKNVFYCESRNCAISDDIGSRGSAMSGDIGSHGILCVLWERTIAQAGDTVVMKGRFKDNIFLAWSMMIKKRSEAD